VIVRLAWTGRDVPRPAHEERPMYALRLAVCLLSALVLVNQAPAADKIDKDKLVGTWTLVKTSGKALPAGASLTVTFTKDGKFTLTGKGKIKDEVKESKLSGTYKVDGNKVVVTLKAGDKEKSETRTVKELTDKKLVVERKNDKGETETVEFKK